MFDAVPVNRAPAAPVAINDKPALAERREHDRHLTIFRVAKLTADKVEGLCVARNVSSGGMMLDVLTHYGLGQIVRVSLAEDHHLHGRVIWQRESTIGIQFEVAIDVGGILAKPAILPCGHTRRMPRMQIRQSAEVRVGSKSLPVEIYDISQRGAKLKTDHEFDDHDMAWLVIKGLSPACGTIRWQLDGYAGIEFAKVIPIADLMHWLGNSNRADLRHV